MQTIRIYSKRGGLVCTLENPSARVYNDALSAFPESDFFWLR